MEMSVIGSSSVLIASRAQPQGRGVGFGSQGKTCAAL